MEKMLNPIKNPDFDPKSVLIMAPIGQDAFLLSSVLKKNELGSETYLHIEDICDRLSEDAGAILVAEEVLTEKALTTLTEILARQEPWSDIPIIVMTSGGETTLMSLRILRAFAPSGNVTLLERPFRPITLVSTLQVALRARARQYQVREFLQKQVEATRMRDEFISIASHELKTPLTSLKLHTQIIQRMLGAKNPDFFTVERVEKWLDTVARQSDRLARLVEDMLDISRINTGKLTIQKTEVDLRELVEEVVDRMQPQMSSAGCELHLDLDTGVRGHWDRYRIEQVISNLLTNAVRYASGKAIWVSVSQADVQARLVVKDDGDGIAPENLGRIFNRFERAVSSGNISGLGLGLYICREILDSHQGSIRVESVPGKGATFIVELPLKNREDGPLVPG